MKKESLTRVYLFVLFTTLPLDWFAPTGNLLREFGAKPAAPLVILGSIFIFLFHRDSFTRIGKPAYCAALGFALIFLLGCFAFWINSIYFWSGLGGGKTPTVQFVAQAGLFAAFSVAVIAHSQLFKNAKWRSFALSILPAVILIHLAVFSLEAAGMINRTQGWLSLFRNSGGIDLGRPSGLMSEPSYFGAFAAIYGLPLLVIRSNSGKVVLGWVLACFLFAASIAIRAKTFIPVLGLEFAILLWHRGRSVFRLRYILFTAILLAASLYVIISNAALDMQENLSSAMRIGSTELALNAADNGYGLTGIGFGQFHFFYRAEFAPNFLFASQEAQDQMTGSIQSRASTYNLYARLLIETGFLGLSCFLIVLFQLLRGVRRDYRASTVFGLLLTAGSLGFLLTQDTYFYPPLAVGLALVLGSASDRSTFEHDVSSVITE